MAGPDILQQLIQLILKSGAAPVNTEPYPGMGTPEGFMAHLTPEQMTYGAGMGAGHMEINPALYSSVGLGQLFPSANQMASTSGGMTSLGGEAAQAASPQWNPTMLKDMGGTIRDVSSGAGSGIGDAASNIGGAVGSALKFPFQHPFATAAGGGGIAELMHLIGGGGNTQPGDNPSDGSGGAPPAGPMGIYGPANAQGAATYGGYGTGTQGTPGQVEDPFTKAIKAAIAQMNGGGDTASQQTNANANMIQAQAQSRLADAQIANYQATQEIAKRDQATKEGNLDLAKVHEHNANVWSQRAADATDEANALTGRGQDVTMRGQDINARSSSNQNMTTLTGILGNLLNAQSEMQFKLNSTPMNAIASLLMGRGQDPNGQASYAAPRTLGIDPNMFSQLMQSTIMGATQTGMQTGGGMTPVPDLNSMLQQLATKAQGAGSIQQPAAPNDATGTIVGNRIPDYPR